MAQRGAPPNVERARAWARLLFRDIGAPLAGFAMLGYETVYEHADRPWIIVAAMTLLGYPVADRIDKLLKGKEGGGNGGGGKPPEQRPTEDDDPYEGPGGYYRHRVRRNTRRGGR